MLIRAAVCHRLKNTGFSGANNLREKHILVAIAAGADGASTHWQAETYATHEVHELVFMASLLQNRSVSARKIQMLSGLNNVW